MYGWIGLEDDGLGAGDVRVPQLPSPADAPELGHSQVRRDVTRTGRGQCGGCSFTLAQLVRAAPLLWLQQLCSQVKATSCKSPRSAPVPEQAALGCILQMLKLRPVQAAIAAAEHDARERRSGPAPYSCHSLAPEALDCLWLTLVCAQPASCAALNVRSRTNVMQLACAAAALHNVHHAACYPLCCGSLQLEFC